MSVTKKEMKDALINVRAACALSAGHPPIPCSKCLNSNCNIKLNALSRLIEHGPEVSRGTIEFLIFGPDIWKDCDKDTINALIFYLHSQGVEEKK